MSETLQALSTHLTGKFGEKIAKAEIAYGDLTVTVAGEDIVEVVTFLRDDPACQFVSFVDVCGADYPSRAKRFDVVYHLLSPRKNLRIRVKVMTDEDTPVPSITGVYPGADWFERETYDLYGVLFSGSRDCQFFARMSDFSAISSMS